MILITENNAREGTKPEIIGQQKKNKNFFQKLMKPDETSHDSLTSFIFASKNKKRDTGMINRNNLEQFLSVMKRLS